MPPSQPKKVTGEFKSGRVCQDPPFDFEVKMDRCYGYSQYDLDCRARHFMWIRHGLADKGSNSKNVFAKFAGYNNHREMKPCAQDYEEARLWFEERIKETKEAEDKAYKEAIVDCHQVVDDGITKDKVMGFMNMFSQVNRELERGTVPAHTVSKTEQFTISKLPWKNKTTVPKLCQVRDNLYAKYPSLAPLTVTSSAAPQQKKEKKMCYDCDNTALKSDEQTKRDYIRERIYSLKYDVEDRLRAQFNIGKSRMDRPRTMEEFLKRIKDGKYKFADKLKDQADGSTLEFWDIYSLVDNLRWVDPEIVEDYDGYHAAEKEFEKAKQAALDLAALGDLTEATKAMQALENWQPSGKSK